jgi:ACS family D-galactonate transporter-like MFS transporter
MDRSLADRSSAVCAVGDVARRSGGRWKILALVAAGTTINYLDRSLLSIAAPFLSKDLGLNAAVMGIVFSAFSWTYVAAQIPGGVLLDRFGARITYFLSVAFWSLFTALQTFVGGLGSLLAFRLGLGAAEAPCFPANSRILCSWFPQQERARANGVYAVGIYLGIAFLSPVLFWITAHFGWRALFAIVGSLGLAFALVWLLAYREPGESRWANAAEIDHIVSGGGLTHKPAPGKFAWKDLAWLLRQRQIVGASIGQFAGNCTLVFFLTWFPTYLATERHMAWLKVGVFAVLPFISASLGGLAGGVVSDALVKRTGSATFGRKLPIVGGLLLASLISLAAFIDDNAVVIAVMSVAFFGQGMSNLGWTLISDVAPARLVGLTGGVFNLCTNLAGIVTPIIVGFVVVRTGSFFGGLAFIGAVAVIGALSYTFVVGPVKRVEEA